MKGVIETDHIPSNNWQLIVPTAPPLIITEQSGIKDELETTDLPDRTRASGGNRKATEFDITMPAHHAVEQAFMELWFRESQDPVSPGYKKVATLVQFGISGTVKRTWSLTGVFPTARELGDQEMNNEGEMMTVKWSMSADDIEPI